MPTPLTALSFARLPLDLLGMADSFIQLRPEHLFQNYGPVLTQYQAPPVATPAEAKREGSWEPHYGMEWLPVGKVDSSPEDVTTPLRERERVMRKYAPKDVEITPEFVRKLLLGDSTF